MTQPGPTDADDALPLERWRRWFAARFDELGELQRDAARGFVLGPQGMARCGVSRSTARHAVRTGRWSTAGWGAVGVIDVRDADPHVEVRRAHALRAAAATRRRHGDVVSGRSAAILHGLPTLDVPPAPTLTERTPTRSGRASSNHLYRATISDRSITHWYGVPVTTVARTVVDLARHNIFDGIMAADAALRERTMSAAELDRELDAARGWPFVRRARDTVAQASPLAESPLESVTRLRLCREGFPDLQPQHPIGPYRVDLASPAYRLVIECDGRIKYTDDALWNEKKREQYLRQHDWRVERVVWTDVLRAWPRTSRRLWSALGPLHRSA